MWRLGFGGAIESEDVKSKHCHLGLQVNHPNPTYLQIRGEDDMYHQIDRPAPKILSLDSLWAFERPP